MSNHNMVACPNCRHEFSIETALTADIEKEISEKLKEEFNKKAARWQQDQLKEQQAEKQRIDAAYKQRYEDDQKRLREDRLKEEEKLRTEKIEIEASLKKRIAAENEHIIESLKKQCNESETQMKSFRQKEIEFIESERALKNQHEQMQLDMKRKELEMQKQIEEEVKKKEAEKYELIKREYDKKLDDQKKLVEEMNRKIEQGSMQLQGEVQELALEEFLRHTFPYDEISEVGKGVRGADCMQIVKNTMGNSCGKIIYESKRTKDFSNEWINKLKADMRSQNADLAVIVTQILPKGLERFGEKEGVYICTYADIKPLAHVLRSGLLKIFMATSSQENKGDKMELLYNYLTGNEFGEQWKAVKEGFREMRSSIQKERDAMERLWKQREKYLEKVLINASQIQGSIEGISSSGLGDNLLADFGVSFIE